MSNPIVQAFFMGRAVAEVLQEQAERAMTEIFSEIGKFDAEQRVYWRQFTESVQERARSAEAGVEQGVEQGRNGLYHPNPSNSSSAVDLQATLDDLRAEIARLRAELKHQRDLPTA